MDGKRTGAGLAQPAGKSWRSWAGGADLVACAALVGLACLATLALPEGSALRLVITLAVLLFAPGYLLIEAAAGPARLTGSRAWRAVLAIGVSPAIVGLLALATAGLPGGFRAGPIIVLFAVACLALAGAASWRRRAHVRATMAQPASA